MPGLIVVNLCGSISRRDANRESDVDLATVEAVGGRIGEPRALQKFL